jgi:hypothetical protein
VARFTVNTAVIPQDGCEENWGLCLTSKGKLQRSLGSYYTDLPSNILGSFIMGVVGTSAVVGLSDKKVRTQLILQFCVFNTLLSNEDILDKPDCEPACMTCSLMS